MASDSFNNRDSSPDPITLPSSPLRPRSARSNARFRLQDAGDMRASPSRSLVFDTPRQRGKSPWRIKVTVEAQPNQTQQSRRGGRATTVSTEPEGLAGSPVGTPASFLETQHARRRGQRRLLRTGRSLDVTSAEESEGDAGDAGSIFTARPIAAPPRRRNRDAQSIVSGHTKRLSHAREELSFALEDARRGFSQAPLNEHPGDQTVSANEDFSMISIDSLQNAKEHSFSQGLGTVQEGDSSAMSLSRGAVDDREVEYPDISQQAQSIRATPAATKAGSMSDSATHPQSTRKRAATDEEDSSSRLHEVEPQQTTDDMQYDDDEADEDQRVDDDADNEQDAQYNDEDDHQSDDHDEAGDEMDIWQEEASRSMTEEGRQHIDVPQQILSGTTARIDGLFGNEQLKPPRSKLPRTWRRTSGADFSYADSPAPEQVLKPVHKTSAKRKASGGSTDDSGVLTPPSTDQEISEDVEHYGGQAAQSPVQHDSRSRQESLNESAAAITTHYARANSVRQEEPSPPPGSGSESPFSDSPSGLSSPDGEDTGSFFLKNMPQVYRGERKRPRPQRRETANLSDLLSLKSSSPAKVSPAKSVLRPSSPTAYQKQHIGRLHPLASMAAIQPVQSHFRKTIESPLRKSLYKSSKMTSSSVPHACSDADLAPTASLRPNASKMMTPDESLSLRSDKSEQPRQASLTSATTRLDFARPQYSSAAFGQGSPRRDSEHSQRDAAQDQADEQHLQSRFEDDGTELRSYQENLNLESPGRIRVNFDDDSQSSYLHGTSKIAQQSLFSRSAAQASITDDHDARNPSPPMMTLVAKRAVAPTATEPGIISRLSTTFWSAVMRPQGPSEILPEPMQQVIFPADQRSVLRGRYGVCSENFPWTMYHMRTLHRMINSLASGRDDSAVPRRGPLPRQLARLIDTPQISVAEYEFVFTRLHAYALLAFLQVLVPIEVVAAMKKGEIEWLGDEKAELFRGYYDPLRHGDDPVWRDENIAGWVDKLHGSIGLDFIVRALGDVVQSNDISAAAAGDE